MVSLFSLAFLALGGAAAAAGIAVPRSVFLTLFFFVGIGSAFLAFESHLKFASRICISFAISSVVIVAISGIMAESGYWHPGAAFAIVSSLAVIAHVVSLLRVRSQDGVGLRDWVARSRLMGAQDRVATGLVALSLVVCLVAALACRTSNPGVGGFLGIISPAWYVGFAVAALISSGLVLRQGQVWIQAIGTCVTGLIITLTPAIVYGLPRSQSAEKHIALSQLVRATGGLHSGYSVYNGWPGFFTGMAWVSDAAHINDPISLATYWPALLVLFRIGALRYLAGRFFDAPRLAWGATLLALLADSLGGDYFSPQSLGFDLGLVVYGIALSKRTGPVRLLLVFAIGATITFSHQLSPFIVGGVLVVLAAFRLVKPWWLPLLVLLPAFGWALLHSSTVSSFISLASFGRPSNFQLPSQRLPGNREMIVQVSIGAVVIATVLLGVLGLVTLLRNRRSRAMWGAACAPLVGVGAVTANAYGNEGVFRAVLFALPWLAILATPTLFAVRQAKPALLLRAGAILVLAVCLLFGLIGLDGSGVERRGDRAVLSDAVRAATADPQRSLLLLDLGPGDVPSSGPTNPSNLTVYAWNKFNLDTQVEEAKPTDDAAYDVIVSNLAARAVTQSAQRLGQADIVAYSSPAQRIYGQEYGLISGAKSDAIVRAMMRSGYWRPEINTDGTFSFTLDAAAYASHSQ